MHWQKLVEASSLYRLREPRDHFYWEYREESRGAWRSSMPQLEDCARLKKFLNQWSTHTPMSPQHLRDTFCGNFHIIEELRSISFMGLTDAHYSKVAELFESTASCEKSRYESTGAAKILHAWLPETLVMWDGAIAAGYGIYRDAASPRPNGRDYALRFLPRVQRQAREAIATCMLDNQLDESDAILAIARAADREPITKLLDEYNYVRYTLSAEELWEN